MITSPLPLYRAGSVQEKKDSNGIGPIKPYSSSFIIFIPSNSDLLSTWSAARTWSLYSHWLALYPLLDFLACLGTAVGNSCKPRICQSDKLKTLSPKNMGLLLWICLWIISITVRVPMIRFPTGTGSIQIIIKWMDLLSVSITNVIPNHLESY
jgi:hypothetical protein